MTCSMSATIELPHTRSAGPETGTGGAWQVIVCNDEHNTFDHVAESLAFTIPGVTLAEGYALADRIHRGGLAIVFTGDHDAAQSYWGQLAEAGLTMAPLERL
jgi:ATP-dependent Clp protease adaptor protein ClpS